MIKKIVALKLHFKIKKEKDLLINTVNTNESNSFINEIMYIINI